MSRRLKLHNALCDILSCPNKGPECRAYFQPPSSVKMKYPAIVYALDDIENTFANDGVYLSARKYSVTVIDSDPDSSLVGKVSSMPTSRFNRHYTKDNLNHDVHLNISFKEDKFYEKETRLGQDWRAPV